MKERICQFFVDKEVSKPDLERLLLAISDYQAAEEAVFAAKVASMKADLKLSKLEQDSFLARCKMIDIREKLGIRWDFVSRRSRP